MNIPLINKFDFKSLTGKNINYLFGGILVLSVVLGSSAGYLLTRSGTSSSGSVTALIPGQAPKSASQDTRTFRDFAEGIIQKKPEPKNSNEYSEGTHLLVRQGAMPVALTSSVVDLSKYEEKRVKVFGETQKAIKEGWLMDVGKVEEE